MEFLFDLLKCPFSGDSCVERGVHMHPNCLLYRSESEWVSFLAFKSALDAFEGPATCLSLHS